jgi:FSR family fosmidomycin resistance protein-like MFS transporter
MQFVVLIFVGLFMLSTTPVIMAMVQESYPENRSLANGIYMSLSFVIRSVAVVAVGMLGDHFGLRTAFMASAAMMFLGFPFVFGLPKKKEGL